MLLLRSWRVHTLNSPPPGVPERLLDLDQLGGVPQLGHAHEEGWQVLVCTAYAGLQRATTSRGRCGTMSGELNVPHSAMRL